MDRIAARRGKWAHEVLDLTPEQLALESLCLHLLDDERAALLVGQDGKSRDVVLTLSVGD